MILSVTGKICGELPRPARECFRPIERTLGIRELCLSVPSRMTPNYPRRAVPCKWSFRCGRREKKRRDETVSARQTSIKASAPQAAGKTPLGLRCGIGRSNAPNCHCDQEKVRRGMRAGALTVASDVTVFEESLLDALGADGVAAARGVPAGDLGIDEHATAVVVADGHAKEIGAGVVVVVTG